MPSALHFAARHENIDALNGLTRTLNASVNIRNAVGSTPLHVAASNIGAFSLVMLLRAGANIDAADDQGCTPLHIAVGQGSCETTRALLSKGASATVQRNKDGCNALHLAVQQRDPSFVEVRCIARQDAGGGRADLCGFSLEGNSSFPADPPAHPPCDG